MSAEDNPTGPATVTSTSPRGSPSDRIIKPRPRNDSLQSMSGASEGHPNRVVKPRARKSPGSGAKRSETSKRRFMCSFRPYGCDVALSSKNEWKRHVSIQHLQLGFYRCDVGPCNPDLNPGIPGHKRVYNDFNRKDLFTQHHRRMHKPDKQGVDPQGISTETLAQRRAFEDGLEDVRRRCWQERRKPPQRSTCGFCGRVFDGDGSWNDRMEHVGGHYSRDIEPREEREDEDLTNWSIQEGIVKEVNGRHYLIDQPPMNADRLSSSRDQDTQMSDAPTPTRTAGSGETSEPATSPSLQSPLHDRGYDGYYRDDQNSDMTTSPRRHSHGFPTAYSNGLNGRLESSRIGRHSISSTNDAAHGLGLLNTSALAASVPPSLTSPTSPRERRGYNLAPPPLQSMMKSADDSSPSQPAGMGSGDRLEDLINQLIKPKPPKTHRRLTWKCDCDLELSVDIEDADKSAISSLQDISIICCQTSAAYLKVAKAGKYSVVSCDELAGHVWKISNQPVEQHLISVKNGRRGSARKLSR